MSVARIDPGPVSEAYATRIGEAWGRLRGTVVAVGKLLVEAKATLPHGSFEAMIAADLPFTAATARKLMAVAQASFLDRAPGHDLPGDWTTLYELTKLGADGFQAALESGAVHADMTRAAAGQQVKRWKAAQATAGMAPTPSLVGCDVADLERVVAAGLKFRVIYVDFPWAFETRSDKGADRSPQAHYRTMSIDEILAFCPLIKALAADDAMMFPWVVPWVRPYETAILEACGFTYQTVGFYWAKAGLVDGDLIFDTGTGYYTRKAVEQCLIATRGNPSPLATDVMDLRLARVGAHSEKPDAFARDIEKISTGPYLELFARRPRDGWSVWGDQVAPSGVFERSGGVS